MDTSTGTSREEASRPNGTPKVPKPTLAGAVICCVFGHGCTGKPRSVPTATGPATTKPASPENTAGIRGAWWDGRQGLRIAFGPRPDRRGEWFSAVFWGYGKLEVSSWNVPGKVSRIPVVGRSLVGPMAVHGARAVIGGGKPGHMRVVHSADAFLFPVQPLDKPDRGGILEIPGRPVSSWEGEQSVVLVAPALMQEGAFPEVGSRKLRPRFVYLVLLRSRKDGQSHFSMEVPWDAESVLRCEVKFLEPKNKSAATRPRAE